MIERGGGIITSIAYRMHAYHRIHIYYVYNACIHCIQCMLILYLSVSNTRLYCNLCMYTLYTMQVLMVMVQMHETHTTQIQNQYVSRVLCMCAKESMHQYLSRVAHSRCPQVYTRTHHTHTTTHMHTCTRAHNNIIACDAYAEVRVLRMLLSSDDVMNQYASLCPRPPSLTLIRKFTHVNVHPRLRACVCACMHACLCVFAHIVQYSPLTDTCSPHTHTHTHMQTRAYAETRAYVQANVSAHASYAHTHEHICLRSHVCVCKQTHAYLVQHACIFLVLCSASMGPPETQTVKKWLLRFPLPTGSWGQYL